MEKNINLAKILNGKPVNTKLWSPLFGDVYTSSICSEDTIIVVNHHAESSSFYNNGKYFDHAEAEPLLFPSKEMRDWSKFTWKKGDVLISNDGKKEVFFNGFTDDTYALFKAKHGFEVLSDGNTMYLADEDGIATSDYTLEDKDVTQTYINTIEERLGGKLNLETLEIEKNQPEFKDGDIVVYGKSVAICRRIYKHTLSFYVSLNEMVGLLFADEVESSEEYRFATDEDKQQLFDALEKEGKAWDAEKKQIVDLKPKVELKPFDKVLIRDINAEEWKASFFSYKEESHYVCIEGHCWSQCIPYEGNEHLLGTTKDVEG
ncbi:hypothetical protein [Prevotella sp.]|nr:hypothetical protein [Prevotella sp.]